MHNIFAVAKRVLNQFVHDKRTLVVLLIAPCLVLWLFSILLGAPSYPPRLAVVDVPQTYTDYLQNERCNVIATDAADAEGLLENNEVDAVLSMASDRTLNVKVEGADASKSGATLSTVRSALVNMQRAGKTDLTRQADELQAKADSLDFNIDSAVRDALPETTREAIDTAESLRDSIPDVQTALPITDIQTDYLHGSGNWTNFEFYGPIFIGIFIFVFVFLTSSMSLLTERSGGTVRRLIATPVKSWQIVGGYVLGFGVLTLMQSAIILWFCIYLIGFPNVGNLALVAFLAVSMALVSLTLGLLVSGLAHTPFQVIQLLILFVVPQILLSGIFDLSQTPDWMQAIAAVFPIYYGADALRDVMLRGADMGAIAANLIILWGFIVVFFALACLNFRKKRAPAGRRSDEDESDGSTKDFVRQPSSENRATVSENRLDEKLDVSLRPRDRRLRHPRDREPDRG